MPNFRWRARADARIYNSEQSQRLRRILAEVTKGPDLTSATCASIGGDYWYPEQGGVGQSKKAVALCKGCPVRRACLERTLDTPDAMTHWGIWAGYTAVKIRRMRRLRDALRRAEPTPTITEAA